MGRCVVTNVGPTQESDLHVSVVGDVEVGQVGSRVELFEQIRRDRRTEGLSIRELAEDSSGRDRGVDGLTGPPGQPPQPVAAPIGVGCARDGDEMLGPQAFLGP